MTWANTWATRGLPAPRCRLHPPISSAEGISTKPNRPYNLFAQRITGRVRRYGPCVVGGTVCIAPGISALPVSDRGTDADVVGQGNQGLSHRRSGGRRAPLGRVDWRLLAAALRQQYAPGRRLGSRQARCNRRCQHSRREWQARSQAGGLAAQRADVRFQQWGGCEFAEPPVPGGADLV